ncbi:hypothetical protein [Segatella oris]|uniref:hypothetical protein n=1 Tax=Segatella oris TaxID=28135 RepID=UPI00241E46F0|nr:hypothetical protein [Segatella oris]
MKRKLFFSCIATFSLVGLLCSFTKQVQSTNKSSIQEANISALNETAEVGCECVISLKHICTCGHTDHYGYKNEYIIVFKPAEPGKPISNN